MKKILRVFSTKRNIRSYEKTASGLIDKLMSIGEFMENAVYVPNLAKASEALRLVCMQLAANRTKEAKDILGIPDEFFAFLKNNEYLFAFFKELENEFVKISDLKNSDIYVDYDEHLKILENLEENYIKNLEQAGFYDQITLPRLYKINDNFIKQYDEIILKIDGSLSKFDENLFLEISKITKLIIQINIGEFNIKTRKWLENYLGSTIEKNQSLELDFSEKKILSKTPWQYKTKPMLSALKTSTSQAAFVFDEVSKFIRLGLEPEKIAVILPDESFASFLQICNDGKLLNFANAKNFTKTKEFAKLVVLKEALEKNFNYKAKEDYFEDKNIKFFDELMSKMTLAEISDEEFKKFKNAQNKILSYEEFKSVMFEIFKDSKDEIKNIVNKELFNLKNIFNLKNLKFEQILELLELSLKSKKLSSVGGGKVTVMGILESRGEEFDGVVIVNFNDNLVPKRSEKEMFLNSKVRKNSGLASHQDRENLQRFYYESLIKNAKNVSISYVENDDSIASRFLNSFPYQKAPKLNDNEYFRALASAKTAKINLESDFLAEHDFFAYPMSFSRLDTFLNSPRKYYFQYIKNLKEAKEIGLNKANIGSALHECLEKYFETNKNHFDAKEFEKLLDERKDIDRLSKAFIKEVLPNFEKYQNEHFEKGYKVYKCEENFDEKSPHFEQNFQGKIDRIDINENGDLLLIDYKSGNIPNDSLQIEFYKYLIQNSNSNEFKNLNLDEESLKGFFISFKENANLNASKKPKKSLEEILEELKQINNTQICFEQKGQKWQYFKDELLKFIEVKKENK